MGKLFSSFSIAVCSLVTGLICLSFFGWAFLTLESGRNGDLRLANIKELFGKEYIVTSNETADALMLEPVKLFNFTRMNRFWLYRVDKPMIAYSANDLLRLSDNGSGDTEAAKVFWKENTVKEHDPSWLVIQRKPIDF